VHDHAKIEQAVFDLLRPQLKQCREQVADLKRAVASSIAKVNQHAEDVVVQRRRELRTATEQLKQCQAQEDANCSGFHRKVEECDRALERAVQGRALVQQATSRFQHQQVRYDTIVDQLLIRAGKVVRTADERTISYQKAANYIAAPKLLSATPLGGSAVGGGNLASGGTAGTAAPTGGGGTTDGAASWRERPGVSVPATFPPGFALIPMSLIVDDSPVTGSHDFDNGQDLPALRWATEACVNVVLPAMNRGGDARHYFTERDARENRTGSRSYAATYDGFFTQRTAIKLGPLPDGTFCVNNGRHRMWLLTRAGAQSVPAYISGGG